jgi:DnaK suppressor protein
MIVSLLQLMGFGRGKSIQSRADSDSGEAPASLDRRASGVAKNGRAANHSRLSVPDPEHAQSAPSRRPEVKTKPVSKAKTKAAKAPLPAPRKEAKVKLAPKAASKAVVKPVAKSSKSAVSKAAPKVVAKVVKKVVAKNAVATTSKSAPKNKASSKAVVTPKASSGKTSATSVAPKAAVKSAAKTKAVPVRPVKPLKKEISALSTSLTSSEKKSAKPESENIAAAASAQAAVPARSPRVSSRLAQLTVPSMAAIPAVASTAAKASYGEASTSALPAPPHFVPVKKDPKLAHNWKTKPVAQWSDEEVVAMPDAEYMNEGQMAFFRLKLVQLKLDILANAGETTEHLREETVVVPDPADRATIEEEHALELRTRDRERKLLKKIEQSMARIDAGDYGYCDETGEAIGVSRLLARPTATLSLEAQQRRELKQKMFGD